MGRVSRLVSFDDNALCQLAAERHTGSANGADRASTFGDFRDLRVFAEPHLAEAMAGSFATFQGNNPAANPSRGIEKCFRCVGRTV